jgi:branched-chain amino acid transport system permease protein
MRNVLRVLGFLLFVAIVLVLPSRVSDFRSLELAQIGIFFIAILGLNVLTGYTGVISLGHGAFMAVGAYTTAILVADHGVKDLYTIPVAGLVALAAGFAFGIPALRLSGPYLALATFGVAVSTPIVIKKFDGFTGGTGGINLFESPDLTGAFFGVHVLGRTLTFNDWIYYLTWVIALALFVVAWTISVSPFGRALRAVRDNEIAATASGIWSASHKTVAFAISAFYAGIAGSLFAIHANSVSPGGFPADLSIQLLVGLAVGGLGTLAPLVAGATFLVYLPQWAQDLSKSPGAPAVIYGAVLIVLMVVVPGGAGGLLRRVASPLTTRLYARS